VAHDIHKNLFSYCSIAHLEDAQNQTIICDNHSTTQGFGASIITTRQRSCLAAFVGKLDFSSREDPAVREHESRQTDNKKKEKRIIALSRNPARQKLARAFGATDILASRGEEANEAVLSLTDGVGVDAALECVGTNEEMQTALAIARPGSIVGDVGVPHGVEIPVPILFYRNVGVHGGPPSARAYIPELLDDVLEGHINPGRVFDFTTDLGGIAEAYAAMDKRRAIKSLVKVGTV
jgi:hypothetical protein